MSKHGTGANQPELLIDRQIVDAVWKQIGNSGDFAMLLRQVRLHQAIRMLGPQRSGCL